MYDLAGAAHLQIALQCEFLALEGLGEILKVVDRLNNAGVNRILDVGGFVMPMYDSRMSPPPRSWPVIRL